MPEDALFTEFVMMSAGDLDVRFVFLSVACGIFKPLIKAITRFEKKVDIKIITPILLLPYIRHIAAPDTKAGPEEKQKQQYLLNSSDEISRFFLRLYSIFAPTGYPDMFDRRNTEKISCGILKTYLEIGENNFPIMQ